MVLKIDYDIVKFQKVSYDVIFDVIKITLPKIRHHNDVTSFSFISSPSLSKILVVPLLETLSHLP